MIDYEIKTSQPRQRKKHPIRSGVVFSGVFHATMIGLLIAAPVFLFMKQPRVLNVITVTYADVRDSQETAEPKIRLATDPSQVTSELLQQRLNEKVAEADTRSEDENLEQFESLAGRLEEISSEKRIEQLASSIGKFFGTKKRATAPSDDTAEGEFDHETAQMHDVRREETAEEQFQYWAILIDAEGHVMEVEMANPEGETMYKTMRRLKAFPLADKVYRQIAMPLIDKLLQAKGDTQSVAPAETPMEESNSDL